MKFDVKIGFIRQSCVIIGVCEDYCLSDITKQFSDISNDYVKQALYDLKFKGELGKYLLLYHVPKINARLIIIVGYGKQSNFNWYGFKKIIKTVSNIIKHLDLTEISWFLTDLQFDINNYWKTRFIIENLSNYLYTFDQFKSQTKDEVLPRKLVFCLQDNEDIDNVKLAIKHGSIIAKGIKIAKDLSNMPPNICNASYLACQARNLETIFDKIRVEIINEREMKNFGMNAYLAVSAASKNESFLSVINYNGCNNKTKPIVLIGKGLTFDTGGISLKPARRMEEMKYDMCGAASVYAIMTVVAELCLPINVIGILAGCENMIGSNAVRPGDILKTMSGQTVEILNTDAEGRLVLCDVLTYIERFTPKLVIDIATLTGACVVALGHNFSGLLSNNNRLADSLIKASKEANDPIWRLPISDEYQEQLKSNVADMVNVGSDSAGAITAACFLARFANNYNWAHIDIAGTAWSSGKNRMATGRPVALISQFLINNCFET